MAHLRELHCHVDLPPPGQQLAFPAQLRRLGIDFPDHADAVQINGAVAAISRLSLLEELGLVMDALDPHLSFAPLADLPLLRRLKISQSWGQVQQLSDAQIDELRALPQLQEIDVPMTPPLMRRLLRQPHDLQWQQIPLPGWLADEAAALLPLLPSLTAIPELVTCDRFDWLRGLPNLTDARLWFSGSTGAESRAESPVAALHCCTKIEILALSRCRELTAAQLAELLPRLPKLRELRLQCLDIESLAFLAQPPLTSQLSRLDLSCCTRLPLTELRHVHALLGLEQLTVCQSFAAPLDSFSRSQLTPPCALLPRLQQFEYTTVPEGTATHAPPPPLPVEV
jgi:hypothetical protein